MGLSSVSLNGMLRLFCAASLLKKRIETFPTLRSQPSASRNHDSQCVRDGSKPGRGPAARGVVGVMDPATVASRNGVAMQSGKIDAPVVLVCVRVRGAGVIGTAESRRLRCSIHG
jgi:hypothetical protein